MFKYSELRKTVEYLDQQPGLEAYLQLAAGDCVHKLWVREGKRICVTIYRGKKKSLHYIFIAQNSHILDKVTFLPEKPSPIICLAIQFRLQPEVYS